MRLVSLALASLVLSTAGPAFAQSSNTTGFMGAIRLSSVSLTRPIDEDTQHEAEAGGGVGLRAGWGVSQNFTLFAGLDVATLKFKSVGASGDYSSVHLDLGVQYHFANGIRKVVPYFEAGVTGLAVGAKLENPGVPAQDFVHGGSGGMLGVGVNYFVKRATALNLSIDFTAATFENAKIGDTEQVDTAGDAGSVRLNFGLTFFPMKSK